MSFDEFEACIAGYNKANGGGSSHKDMSDATFDALASELDRFTKAKAD